MTKFKIGNWEVFLTDDKYHALKANSKGASSVAMFWEYQDAIDYVVWKDWTESNGGIGGN